LGRDGGLAANQGFLPANRRLVLNPVLDQAVILGKLVHRGAEVHPALAVGAGPSPSPTVRSGGGREEKSNLTQRTSVLPMQVRGPRLPVTRRWSGKKVNHGTRKSVVFPLRVPHVRTPLGRRKVLRVRTTGYGDARIRHRKLVESSRASHTRLRPSFRRQRRVPFRGLLPRFPGRRDGVEVPQLLHRRSSRFLSAHPQYPFGCLHLRCPGRETLP